MVKVKGVCVFPSQVEGILKEIPEVNDSEFHIVVSTTKMYADFLTVRVEEAKTAEGAADPIRHTIENEVKNKISIKSKIEIVKNGTLPRFTHKAKRVVDDRDLKNRS